PDIYFSRLERVISTLAIGVSITVKYSKACSCLLLAFALPLTRHRTRNQKPSTSVSTLLVNRRASTRIVYRLDISRSLGNSLSCQPRETDWFLPNLEQIREAECLRIRTSFHMRSEDSRECRLRIPT